MMPSKVYPIAFYIVLFGGLLLLLTHWKQEQELLTAQLTAKRATEDAARRAKSDLELEIRRLRDFQDEADNELQEDGKKLQLLEETLQNLRSKLTGAERLVAEVQKLRQVYGELQKEVGKYRDENRR